MTMFEWPDPIPGWDLMKWKQETQAEIYEEIKDMSTKEVVEYFRQAGERFDEERKRYQAENKK